MHKIIRTDGTEVVMDGKHDIDVLRKMIGADVLDTVMLADRIHVMLVDDNGYDKNLPVNATATRLYHQVCRPGTTHQILGDVAVVPDGDFGA